MSVGWTESKIIVDGLIDLFACGKCKKTPERPMRYVNCGHFFCDICIYGESTCFQCKIPVRPNEIRPYWLIFQLIQYCQVIRNVTTETKPGNVKHLAKAVHRFITEHNGLVPETDSESDDDIIESTPPCRQNKAHENEMGSSICLDPNNLSSQKRDTQPETAGFVDPTQFSQLPKKKNFDQETTEFIDPKENVEPESVGFVDSSQCSPSRNKSAEPETKGFVSPSQHSPPRRNKQVEPETKGFVSPSQHSPQRRNKQVEPETKGFVSPFQHSPRKRNKQVEPETKEFVTPSQHSPRRKNKQTEPETKGFVSPSQHSPRRKNKQTEPETKGFVSPSQHSSYRRRRSSGLEEKNVETAGVVEPTQINPRGQKRSSEPISLRNTEREQEYETSGYLNRSLTPPGPKRKRFPEKPCKFLLVKSRTEQEDEDTEKIEQASRKDDTQSGNIRFTEPDKNWSLENNISSMEDFTQPGISQKHNADIMLAPESNQMNQIAIPEILIPESCQNIENQINNDSCMKIDKRSSIKNTPRKSLRLASQEKIPSPIKIEEETPSEQLRRIKSLALNRRSKFRKISQTSETARKSPDVEKSLEKIEKILDRHNTISSLPSTPDSQISRENSKEKTPIKSLRRTRTDSRNDDKHSPNKNEKLQRLKSVENLDGGDERKNIPVKSKEKVASSQSARNSEKLKNRVPKSMPRNLNKRNAKGETPLHTACIKGQENYVKALLEAGANPNTKDNANWTPLQEAINLGYGEICKMLLQAGASPNTPAMDSRTALHEAVAHNKLEEAALLLRYNANREVYDKFGKRPIDYAISDEMRALLTDDNKVERIIESDLGDQSMLDQSLAIPNAKVVVFPSNLGSKNRKLLNQLAPKLKIGVATSFRPIVTHLVVETNERNITELTYDVMLAILQGKWILNSQWITISRDLNDISEMDLELFEVHGAPNPNTPTRARINEEKQNPRLFNNCSFYFAIGPRCTWSYEKFEFTKESLTTLVLGGQGEILNREPDPEDVRDIKLTPFHVAHKPIHPLYRCSYYIIYMPGKDEPRIKYNMPHIKSLPVGWFLECIEKFTLVDPLLMGIS